MTRSTASTFGVSLLCALLLLCPMLPASAASSSCNTAAFPTAQCPTGCAPGSFSPLPGVASITTVPVRGQSGFLRPHGIEVAPDGASVFVVAESDANTKSRTIVTVDVATRKMRNLAGISGMVGFQDGVGIAAKFSSPSGLAIVPGTMTLLVADTGNKCVRIINTATGMVATLAATYESGLP